MATKKPAKKPKTEVVDLGKKGSLPIRPGALHRALGTPDVTPTDDKK